MLLYTQMKSVHDAKVDCPRWQYITPFDIQDSKKKDSNVCGIDLCVTHVYSTNSSVPFSLRTMLPVAQPVSVVNTQPQPMTEIVESFATPMTFNDSPTQTEGGETQRPNATTPRQTPSFMTMHSIAIVCIVCVCLVLVAYLLVQFFRSGGYYDSDAALAFLALTAALSGMLLGYLMLNLVNYSVQLFREQQLQHEWLSRDQLHSATSPGRVRIESTFV